MSESPPRKSGLSPSPVSLTLLIVFGTLITLGAIYLFTQAINAPTPVQTGALSKSDQSQNNPVPKQNAIAAATATELPPPIQATDTPALTDTPPLPEPTVEIIVEEPTPYTPGPTAQVTLIPPTEEWVTYHDNVDGFSVSYPNDWYLKTPPPEHEGSARTIQIYSYDPSDPAVGAKGQTVPSNYAVLEISTDSPESMGHPYVSGEPFEEWVHKTWPVVRGIGPKLLTERSITVGGRTGTLQDFELLEQRRIIYLPLGERVLIINHRLEDPQIIAQQVLQMVIESIRFD